MKTHLITIITILSLTIITTVCAQTGEARLAGKISGLEEPVQLRVFYMYQGESNLDTVTVGADGRFSYTAKINEPVMVSLSQLMPRRNSGQAEERQEPLVPRGVQFIFTSENNLTMDANISEPGSFVVKGDKQNEVYQAYSKGNAELEEAYYDVIIKLRREADSLRAEESQALQKERDEIREKMNAARAEFIKNNPDNFGSLYEIILNTHRYENNIDELEELYNTLSPSMKAHTWGKSTYSQVQGLRATAIGNTAPEFKRPDMNGRPISLNDFRGQYVVLDFWGSWCGPCRASHPALIETYNKYKDEGFQIIGIANEHANDLTEAKEKWLTAISEDSIGIWKHVLNNEGNEQLDIVKAYAIAGFPTKFLLDREGKVIGRYLGGSDEMKKKLEEIFGH